MKQLTIFMFFIFLSELLIAQPFRYKQGNDHDRDSIKLLKIKSYKEFITTYPDSTTKQLLTINEYDTNGNLTRDMRINYLNGTTNQWSYFYSPENILLEKTIFYPDTLTPSSQVKYSYDENGNRLDTENIGFIHGKPASYSRIANCYDSLNQLIEIKQYDSQGNVWSHKEFIFDTFGRQTEELVYDNYGKLLWRRPSSSSLEREEEMYGLPNNPDSEMEALKKETILNNTWTGDKTINDGFGYRVFNKNGILLKWVENNYRYHWFEYTFYENER